ncbi:BglG family transcription antiterminator LicT [uncultured Enterococcus sp.]|uniref:BglG family transcription antiterminator LicT n=1 Tax=uncultured Enterococcus sp. TaxID=167972 RepID=UPI0026140F44|nr:PRD domain-containing protein [uncultured Enterococcus sp.]
MKIKKVLNNNTALILDEDGQDAVVMGLGIAFKKKVGDDLDETKIERVFKLESKAISNRLMTLMREIPPEVLRVSEKIVSLAEKELKKQLNANIFLTLTDHIHFTLERYRQGYQLENPLKWEIQRFYPTEYQIGLAALQIVETNFDLTLKKDEAASITMHIVNAELDLDISSITDMTHLIQESLNVIKYYFKMDFDEESLNYQRFLTHLKFFAQRVAKKAQYQVADDQLYQMVSITYPEAFICAEKIKYFVEKKYHYVVSNEELTYLTIHIQRITTRNDSGL